jgi:hypothetical protein
MASGVRPRKDRVRCVPRTRADYPPQIGCEPIELLHPRRTSREHLASGRGRCAGRAAPRELDRARGGGRARARLRLDPRGRAGTCGRLELEPSSWPRPTTRPSSATPSTPKARIRCLCRHADHVDVIGRAWVLPRGVGRGRTEHGSGHRGAHYRRAVNGASDHGLQGLSLRARGSSGRSTSGDGRGRCGITRLRFA